MPSERTGDCPQEVQQKFSARVVQEGIPKSAVEVLVSAYNTDSCPESLKKQILEQPHHALQRVNSIRTAQPMRRKVESNNLPILTLRNDLVLLLRCIKESERQIGQAAEEIFLSQSNLITQCMEACRRFSSLLSIYLSRKDFSLGKTEEVVTDAN